MNKILNIVVDLLNEYVGWNSVIFGDDVCNLTEMQFSLCCLCCRLWVMTVNSLQPSAKLLGQQRYTQNDLMVDPLIVLRCDQRVYRSERTFLTSTSIQFSLCRKGGCIDLHCGTQSNTVVQGLC